MDCEHGDGSLMGTCAVCGDMVCSECFQTIFNTMMCGNHSDREDEGAWEMVGFYADEPVLVDRRSVMDDHGIASLVVVTEEDMWELYVPVEEKDDAFEALTAAADESIRCNDCQLYYSREAGTCPICGIGEQRDGQAP